jgi:hypothetical protein
MLDMNVEKTPQSFYILGYLMELSTKSGNLDFLFFEIWWIWIKIFHEKSIVKVKIIFFRLKFGEFFPQKKHSLLLKSSNYKTSFHERGQWLLVRSMFNFMFGQGTMIIALSFP